MSQFENRQELRKNSYEILRALQNERRHTLIIHYSCESFYELPELCSPRITSIAVRYLDSAQTCSFSIQKKAEELRIPLSSIEQSYNMLEEEMLKDFFKFVKRNSSFNWVHWNMRDSLYGFEALENRALLYRIRPQTISHTKKFDLARILQDKYGVNYVERPKLINLAILNGISIQDCMEGRDEADCFSRKEFLKIHQSTLRKMEIMSSILDLSIADSLKTKSKWKDIYGTSIQGLFEFLCSKWYFYLISNIIFLVIGAIVGNMLAK